MSLSTKNSKLTNQKLQNTFIFLKRDTMGQKVHLGIFTRWTLFSSIIIPTLLMIEKEIHEARRNTKEVREKPKEPNKVQIKGRRHLN